jgi:predicted nucleic acid-binding protein
MRVVIDTNILFSALLNSSNEIAKLITTKPEDCHYYMSDFTLVELNEHREKIKAISKQTDEKLSKTMQHYFQYMDIVGSGIISESSWNRAKQLVADIDPDDVVFVALTIFLDAYLWTGDKVLYSGLKSKGFFNVLLTSEFRLFT